MSGWGRLLWVYGFTTFFAVLCVVFGLWFGVQLLAQSDRGKGLPAEQAVDAIRRWKDAGGTDASVVTMGLGFTATQQHIDHLAEVRQRLDAAGVIDRKS